MKKFFCFACLMTGFVFSSQAQKGSILLYGQMGIRTEKQPGDGKTTNLSINPGVGYQFSDHWTAGVAGGYSHQEFSPVNGTKTRSGSYKIGGFARYTQVLNPIFSIYGHSGVYYQGGKIDDINSNGFDAELIPFVGINVTKHFAVNISFGGISYETSKVKNAKEAAKAFDLNLGQEITIGFSTTFGGEK